MLITIPNALFTRVSRLPSSYRQESVTHVAKVDHDLIPA